MSADYEVLAKIPKGVTQAQFERMLQGLLAERFHLAVHRQDKTFPAYNLTIGKKGPKLKLSEYVAPPRPDLAPGEHWFGNLPVWMTGSAGHWTVHGRAATGADLVKGVVFGVHARVFDKTGLSGRYDFTFEFDSAGAPDAAVDAVRDQLGLDLEAIKISLPVVIVDHVDRTPTSN